MRAEPTDGTRSEIYLNAVAAHHILDVDLHVSFSQRKGTPFFANGFSKFDKKRIGHPSLQKHLNGRGQDILGSCRFKAGDDVTFAINEELGEVPADVIVALVVLVELLHCHDYEAHEWMLAVEALDLAGMLLEVGIEGQLVRSVHFNLAEAGELGIITECAELLDLLIGTLCLRTKLIAGEIQYFQALVGVFVIERIEVVILKHVCQRYLWNLWRI